MEELIKISDLNGITVVSARDLYRFLEYNDSQYARWSYSYITANAFAIEGIDYQQIDKVVEMPNNASRNITDFALTIDFAKRISMQSKTPQGETIRNYFIKMELIAKKSIPKNYSEALRLAADEYDKRIIAEAKVKELEPKAEVYNQISDCTNLKTMGEVAKILGTGRTRLFEILRERKILMKTNLPYQQYIDAGYFVVKAIVIKKKKEDYSQVFVTPKGELWMAPNIKRILTKARL